MVEPNPRQRELIDEAEGLTLVDAGPGTGKTFTISRRYAAIVDQPDVEPDDALLVTFTNNAATEMRDRVVTWSSYGLRELRDAPIQTFHSLCHDVLLEYGFDAPAHLGIDDHLADATRVLDDELVEAAEFRRFFDRFRDDHPEHVDCYRVCRDPDELRSLINQLAAKGVFPTADGWYRDGDRHLDGDAEAFRAAFDAANEPRNDGRKQSLLRSKLSQYGKEKCYLPDAPNRAAVRGDGKAVPDGMAERAFEEDREALKRFVHDVYFGYLEYALARNYVTFGMLQLYAFVLLCEDHRLRDALAFEYVLVDEFQDTSEVQFKLALLLCGTDNLCVVGDWKQSIYGFQYAAVENIVDFEARLERFGRELNDDAERVSFDDGTVRRIELEENYRSTQAVIDFAEQALVVPATGTDEVADDIVDRIVPLRSNTALEHTRIEAVTHDEEAEAVLATVQAIVGNDDYAVEDDGEVRPPTLGDIAVLTRTRAFGRELLHAADQYDVPVAYEGGIELFRTDQAKLVLAWLRILEADKDRGWAVVLEQAGYTLDEITHVLAHEAYPAAMVAFKTELGTLESVGAVAERVLARYGFDGAYADLVIGTVQAAHDATTMTRGDLIRFIERGIETGATRTVSAPGGTDALMVQTIHAAKGLEYPIVVLANMNQYTFPPSGGGSPVISFDDPIGLRQRKVYAEAHGQPHVYHNWRTDVLRRCLSNDYDEERRLLYVAMTRAEHHLVFTAGESPNTFLEALPVEVAAIEPAVEPFGLGETVQTAFTPTVSPPDGPVQLSPHDLMDETVYAETPEGLGKQFGRDLHRFAEGYARAGNPEPGGDEPDWGHVTAYIDSLSGDIHVEQDAVLPLEVDGQLVVFRGIADLVHVRPDRVEVVDFKTDRTRVAEDEYRKQVSIYYHVLDAWYPDREVDVGLFYTQEETPTWIDPLSMADLTQLVGEQLEATADPRPTEPPEPGHSGDAAVDDPPAE